MKLAVIPYGSEWYEAAKRCRHEVLRAPLGLHLSDADVAGEETQLHLVAMDDDGAVQGTVLLKPLSKTAVKLRQMAVAAAAQGKGLGRELVQFAEATAVKHGFGTIELHARISALKFYEKLGYQSEGEPFIEMTVPHIRMTKVFS